MKVFNIVLEAKIEGEVDHIFIVHDTTIREAVLSVLLRLVEQGQVGKVFNNIYYKELGKGVVSSVDLRCLESISLEEFDKF